MYCFIKVELIPISSTGKASLTNSFSIVTASQMISVTRSTESLFFKCLYIKQAKSVCRPSSREINSLENVSPGIKLRFFIQKIEQNEPEKKIPSIAANATSLSANESLALIHLRAHSAFLRMTGTLSMAWKR